MKFIKEAQETKQVQSPPLLYNYFLNSFVALDTIKEEGAKYKSLRESSESKQAQYENAMVTYKDDYPNLTTMVKDSILWRRAKQVSGKPSRKA